MHGGGMGGGMHFGGMIGGAHFGGNHFAGCALSRTHGFPTSVFTRRFPGRPLPPSLP